MRTALVTVLLVVFAAIGARPLLADEIPAAAAWKLVDDLLSADAHVRSRAKTRLIEARDLSLAPALVELIFFSAAGRSDATDVLEALLGKRFERNVKGLGYKAWFEEIGRRSDISPKEGYVAFKARQYGRIDPAFALFLDPSHTWIIRPEEVIFGGPVKDGIPALLQPAVIPAAEAGFMQDGEVVFAVSFDGQHRAYPKRIMVHHEMANDVVGGRAVALSYCTLCAAPVLYDRTPRKGETYSFGSSGLLHRSNKLMYDHQTLTLWSQIDGHPVVGPLVGKGLELEVLPLTFTTWGDWRRRHPDTTVLSLRQGFERDYRAGAVYAGYFASPDLMFPVWNQSDALAPKEVVWVVHAGGREKAYPIRTLLAKGLLFDTAGHVAIVHVADAAHGSVRTYRTGGRTLEWRGEELVDPATGEAFRLTEEALVSRADPPVRLTRVAGHESYWFGWFTTNPDGELYREPRAPVDQRD